MIRNYCLPALLLLIVGWTEAYIFSSSSSNFNSNNTAGIKTLGGGGLFFTSSNGQQRQNAPSQNMLRPLTYAASPGNGPEPLTYGGSSYSASPSYGSHGSPPWTLGTTTGNSWGKKNLPNPPLKIEIGGNTWGKKIELSPPQVTGNSWGQKIDLSPPQVTGNSWGQKIDLSPPQVTGNSWGQKIDLSPPQVTGNSWGQKIDLSPPQVTGNSWSQKIDLSPPQVTGNSWGQKIDLSPPQVTGNSWGNKIADLGPSASSIWKEPETNTLNATSWSAPTTTAIPTSLDNFNTATTTPTTTASSNSNNNNDHFSGVDLSFEIPKQAISSKSKSNTTSIYLEPTLGPNRCVVAPTDSVGCGFTIEDCKDPLANPDCAKALDSEIQCFKNPDPDAKPAEDDPIGYCFCPNKYQKAAGASGSMTMSGVCY